ncbi:MAG TPA: response regulator transcription factor [Bacteroidales bacterium]|nr:response regulator transcription factor [Bacteroidales bacterium]
MIKLLLVEDDDILGFIIKEGMELIGDYEVMWCQNPKAGLLAFDSFVPDVVVSDVEMPGMTGLEMVKIIRDKNPDIPIILETGVSSAKTIVEAYNIGIDNYIKKPFLPAELDAYIQVLMRRINAAPKPVSVVSEPEVVVGGLAQTFGNYKFDIKRQSLESPKKRYELTVTETFLLDLLVKNKGKLVTKETIANTVWGGNQFMNTQSLDVFLHTLRKYLADDSNIRIKTVRGIGYVFEIME